MIASGDVLDQSSADKPKRGIVNIDLAGGGAVEAVTKVLTIGAICSYVAGFLIIEINEGRLGFFDATLLKPRAVAAGAVFLLLVSLPISFTRNILIERKNEDEQLPQTIARLSLSLVDYLTACWATWFMALILFDTPPNSVVGVGIQSAAPLIGALSAAGGTVTVNGLLAFPKDTRGYTTAPRFWIGYSAICVAALAFATSRLYRLPSFRYLIWGVITSIMFHAYARDWRKGIIHSFKLPGLLMILVSTVSLYSTLLFPLIKGNWGGGTPIPALISIIGDSGKPSEELKVDLVESTDSGYYGFPSGQRNVMFIPKSTVQAIEFPSLTRR